MWNWASQSQYRDDETETNIKLGHKLDVNF